MFKKICLYRNIVIIVLFFFVNYQLYLVYSQPTIWEEDQLDSMELMEMKYLLLINILDNSKSCKISFVMTMFQNTNQIPNLRENKLSQKNEKKEREKESPQKRIVLWHLIIDNSFIIQALTKWNKKKCSIVPTFSITTCDRHFSSSLKQILQLIIQIFSILMCIYIYIYMNI